MNQQCHKTRSLFGPYLDGDLGPRALKRVETHLDDCPACREELEAERDVAAAFSALPELSCPQRVDNRIMARLEEEPQKRGLLERMGLVLGSPGWKTVTACAAALVVLMLFLPVAPENNQAVTDESLSGDDGRITHQEAYQARQKARTSLAYVAQLLQDSEEETVNEIFSKKLPQAIRSSLQRVVPVKKEGSDS